MRWFLFVVVTGAAVAAFFWSRQASPVRVVLVSRGDVASYIDERAKTTLPKTWQMTMPLAGRVKPITLVEGTPVKRGDLLAELLGKRILWFQVTQPPQRLVQVGLPVGGQCAEQILGGLRRHPVGSRNGGIIAAAGTAQNGHSQA